MMRNKKLIIILMLIFFFLSNLPFAVASSKVIRWYSYKEGMAKAKKERKKIFLYFYTGFCIYCRKMERKTFKHKAVVSYLNKNYIPIRVNLDKEKIDKYKISGVPDTWLLSKKEEKITRLPGYISPDKMLKILKFIHTESYKKMSFNRYLKEK